MQAFADFTVIHIQKIEQQDNQSFSLGQGAHCFTERIAFNVNRQVHRKKTIFSKGVWFICDRICHFCAQHFIFPIRLVLAVEIMRMVLYNGFAKGIELALNSVLIFRR